MTIQKDWNNQAHLETFVQALAADPPTITSNDRKHSKWSRIMFWTHHHSDAHYGKSSSITYSILWFPLFILILSIIIVELTLYVLVRQIVNVWEHFYTWRGRRQELRQQLRMSTTFRDYKQNAQVLDNFLGRTAWKSIPQDQSYDWRIIKKLERQLRDYRQAGNVEALKDVLGQACVKSNFGGIEHRRLYSMTYWGTKDLIESYVSQVEEGIRCISNSSSLSLTEKDKFFRLASKNYGKTALCLSGGATFGYYHLGVIIELIEQNLLPKVITGTSAGSMIAAMVCVRTDDEIRDIIKPGLHEHLVAANEPVSVLMKRLYSEGNIFSALDFAEKCQWATMGSTTFREAYERTGRILSISVVPMGTGQAPNKVLNYITAPDCIIWTAVLASSAIPGVLNPVVLLRKLPDGSAEPFLGNRWRDGSLRSDIPSEALKYYFNVRHTIVSQVNPHITLFFYDSRGGVGHPSSHLHGRGLRGGFVLSALEHYLKLDLAKYLRVMRDLELLPRPMNQDYSYMWLQRFHGNITVVPRFDWRAWPRLLTDPNEEWTNRYISEGRKCVWPRIKMLENRLRIERAIWEGRKNVVSQMQSPPLPKPRRLTVLVGDMDKSMDEEDDVYMEDGYMTDSEGE